MLTTTVVLCVVVVAFTMIVGECYIHRWEQRIRALQIRAFRLRQEMPAPNSPAQGAPES